MKTPLFKPLSIKQYALLFTLAIALIFTGYGIFAQHGVTELKAEIQAANLAEEQVTSVETAWGMGDFNGDGYDDVLLYDSGVAKNPVLLY